MLAKVWEYLFGPRVYYVRVFLAGQDQPRGYFTVDPADLFDAPRRMFPNEIIEKVEAIPF